MCFERGFLRIILRPEKRIYTAQFHSGERSEAHRRPSRSLLACTIYIYIPLGTMTWISKALKNCNLFSCYRKIEELHASKEKLTDKVFKGERPECVIVSMFGLYTRFFNNAVRWLSPLVVNTRRKSVCCLFWTNCVPFPAERNYFMHFTNARVIATGELLFQTNLSLVAG